MKYNIDKFLQSMCQKQCYLIRSYDQENYIGNLYNLISVKTFFYISAFSSSYITCCANHRQLGVNTAL